MNNNSSLTKEQVQDKIFELEMELKELSVQLDSFQMENKFYMDCDMVGGIDTSDLEKQIEETVCYIQYYKAELQYLDDMK